jgi:ribosomal small subunit protein bTHX
MGKGDLPTKQGKIDRGAYGKVRPKPKKAKGRETKS